MRVILREVLGDHPSPVTDCLAGNDDDGLDDDVRWPWNTTGGGSSAMDGSCSNLLSESTGGGWGPSSVTPDNDCDGDDEEEECLDYDISQVQQHSWLAIVGTNKSIQL